MSAQQAASLASAAGNAASGNYVQAAANLAAALFGGSKKTPSVLQGFEVNGTFGTSGFAGTVTAFDQKGNRWDQPLESQWLGSLGTGLLSSGKYGAGVNDGTLQSFLSAAGPVPVSVKVPGDSTYPQYLASSIFDTLNNMTANTAPLTPSGTDLPSTASGAAAQPTVVVTDSGLGKLVPVLILAVVAYFYFKRG